MTHPKNDSLISESLRARLRGRQCVAFVGAGLSMSCGMPDWKGLLGKLLDDAEGASADLAKRDHIEAGREAIKNGHYVLAASLVRELMTPGDLDELVRRQFGNHVLYRLNLPVEARDRTLTRMENLVKAPWAGIVTTNYDELIEHAIDQSRLRDEVVKARGDDPRLGTILANTPVGGFFFVKVHGSISASRIVFATEEYDRVYLGTPQMTAFLTALILRYHLVFIGCSLEDELLRLRRTLCQHFQRIIPTSYAVLQGTPTNRSRRSWLREQALIDCLFYPEEDKEHKAVDQFLQEAANCARDPAGEVTGSQSELSQLSPEKRLDQIGMVNRELVELIVSQPDHSIRHQDLINLKRVEGSAVGSSLAAITPEERHYRMLFLASIGLVEETRGEGDTHQFLIKDENIVRAMARSHSGPSDGSPVVPHDRSPTGGSSPTEVDSKGGRGKGPKPIRAK